MTLIEIKPHRWGWKVFEGPGVEPVFPEKDQAINCARWVIRSWPMNVWLFFNQPVKWAVFAFGLNRTLAMLKTITRSVVEVGAALKIEMEICPIVEPS